MSKGAFKRILETLTNNTNSNSEYTQKQSQEKTEASILGFSDETTFQLCKTVRHGFPNKPTAIAYDPVQKLLAIGCQLGSIRILGQPGVDCYVTHDSEAAVVQLLFLANQGALISRCADNKVHLWNFRQKKPAVLQSLHFKRESITCCHLPHKSSWIYVGTDKGNTNVCNIETFNVSGYTVHWNKAIDILHKSNPGPVIAIYESPVDENLVLISFQTGIIVLWDLKNQSPEQRYSCENDVLSTSWHSDGKQFMCSHRNGSLSTWDCKSSKPVSVKIPHAKDKATTCNAIYKVQWLSTSSLEPYVIFSGGLPSDMPDRTSVTVMRGRNIVALEVGHPLVDFTALISTPWACDNQNPKELAILTENELVMVDLETPGYPSIDLGHPMDIHYSPVTCLKYVPDPSTDLIPGLYQVANRRPSRNGISKKDWPITGGEWSVHECDGMPELFVTGHADGCVRFWDASAVFLKSIYKLRTKKLFKKEEDLESSEEDSFQINHITLCPESRTLAIANGASFVVIYKLAMQETLTEVNVLHISSFNDAPDHSELHGNEDNVILSPIVPDNHLPSPDKNQTESDGCTESDRKESSESNHSRFGSIRVKPGRIRQNAGFQADLVCFLWNGEADSSTSVTSMTINTSYQLLAVGSFSHISVVDFLRKVCVFSMNTAVVLRSINKKIQLKSPNLLKPGMNGTNQPAFTFDTNLLPTSADETTEANGKQGESKTKWKAVAKKSRYTTKSIGDYFSQSRSLLSFRRSSLVPKSPTSISPPDPSPHRSQTTIDICVSNSDFPTSPDQETSPSPEDEDVAPSSDEVNQPSKIKFMLGDDNPKKPDAETGLKPESVRSRGSSISESDPHPQELVSFLLFANNFTKQSESMLLPSLWVGTGCGYLFSLIIHLPSSTHQRASQPIIVSPSGSLLKLKGGIIHCNFLDSSGHIMSPGAGNWRDHSCSGTIKVSDSSKSFESGTDQSNQSAVDKQFMVVCSEQQAKVFTLPSQACMQAVSFNTASLGLVTNASVDPVIGDVCLTCATNNGSILVYGLPSLNLFLESPYFQANDARISHTICFGVDGQLVYMPSSSEIQRLTYSLDTLEEMQDFFGHLFIPRQAPERVNSGFFKGLFGGGHKAVDREELFSVTRNGRASRGVAQHLPGSGQSSLEGLRAGSGSFVTDIRKLHMQMRERGEKLTETEEKTEQMNQSAMRFSSDANALLLKYRNKKWYQL